MIFYDNIKAVKASVLNGKERLIEIQLPVRSILTLLPFIFPCLATIIEKKGKKKDIEKDKKNIDF